MTGNILETERDKAGKIIKSPFLWSVNGKLGIIENGLYLPKNSRI